MSAVPYPPQRPLSVGEVLDLSFRIYRATVVKCLLFAGCGVITGQLANLYTIVKGRAPVAGVTALEQLQAELRGHTMCTLSIIGQPLLAELRDPATWVSIIGGVLAVVFYAAVLLRQRAMISDGVIGGEVATALSRVPAFIGLGLLVLLGCAACLVPALLSCGAVSGLLLLPAVIVLCYAFVAISCALTVLFIEGTGPVASLARGWRLTAGSFWRLSLIYSVALVIYIALGLVIVTLAEFIAAVLGRGDITLAMASAEVVGVILGALATPFFYGALPLAVLADLKVRKEGADLEQRISAMA